MIVVGCAAPAPVPSSAEQEARATFVELVDVSKKRQLDRFKALIAAADLEEMEALDKEKPGFFEMLMALIAEGGDPSEYTADVKDDRVIFVRRIREKTADSSSTETTTVTMVRQGNQWRLGKPRT
jgi:hypothetical protein